MTREEMKTLGWEELDVLLVSGDAYVDSHAFGIPLLGRWLVAHGYRTGLVCQPNWETTEDMERLGRPRLFAGISAGALDSLVAHYTAFRKKRHDDAYTPGGVCGKRPNRAVLVYTGLVRRAFPGLPVAIGGVEASLRRATHYDFWSDSLRRSIVLDSKADVLLYGMAEKAIVELARLFASSPDARSAPAAAIAGARIKGTAYALHPDQAPDGLELPSHEAILAEAPLLVKTALAFEQQMLNGKPRIIQRSGGRAVVFEEPAALLDQETMDRVYALPFTRKAHPSYSEPIPAVEMLAGSITSHRGCGGGCSFCSLASHQGRAIQSRSAESLLAEIDAMAADPGWKGAITDIGGPSANMWQAVCAGDASTCKRQSCLFPKRCRYFKARQEDQIALLRQAAARPGVSHVRVASGVRYDLALESEEYMRALAQEFTGGQLKIAPEHIAEKVLRLMRKPGKKGFETFLKQFARHSEEAGKEQYVIPYLMSAFPGCGDAEMRELAGWLTKRGFRPKQVQCFIPTPGTVASAMFYAGVDCEGRPIEVARKDAERLFQHRILLPEAGKNPESENSRSRQSNAAHRSFGRRSDQPGYRDKRSANSYEKQERSSDGRSWRPKGDKPFSRNKPGTVRSDKPYARKERSDSDRQWQRRDSEAAGRETAAPRNRPFAQNASRDRRFEKQGQPAGEGRPRENKPFGRNAYRDKRSDAPYAPSERSGGDRQWRGKPFAGNAKPASRDKTPGGKKPFDRTKPSGGKFSGSQGRKPERGRRRGQDDRGGNR